MERVFRLRRRIHPTTGARIDFDDAEKKDLIMVEGGEDMQKLFKYTGKVLDTDTYQEAVDKIKAALKKRGNRTSVGLGDLVENVVQRTCAGVSEL